MRKRDEATTIPAQGEIFLDTFQLGVGKGRRAVLRTEDGYIIWIVAPCMAEETGDFILNEYLDELGYDNNIREEA
jgi:hypothetical protein